MRTQGYAAIRAYDAVLRRSSSDPDPQAEDDLEAVTGIAMPPSSERQKCLEGHGLGLCQTASHGEPGPPTASRSRID